MSKRHPDHHYKLHADNQIFSFPAPNDARAISKAKAITDHHCSATFTLLTPAPRRAILKESGL